jgi:MoxR-like ATPase
MEMMIAGRMREPEKIKHSQLSKLLYTKKPLLIIGKSGEGKTAKVMEYAKETGKKLIIISLAMEMPETIGGIPYAKVDEKTKIAYFVKLLDERLQVIFENEGEDIIIFFDEINQGLPEVFNALYSICHPDPAQRNWNGHSLAKAQIVAAGNKDDGSDGTTYLNSLPTPLLNRFFIAELVSDRKETMDYLKTKWKNIPQVTKYINELLNNDIPPRDIDQCLEIIAYELEGLLLQLKLGSALATKLYDIQKKVKIKDPAETLKACREGYRLFKELGHATWAGEMIETEEDLIEKFSEILSEEEIQSILKGDE